VAELTGAAGGRRRRPLVIGHRGDPSGAPEQTLAAYELAVLSGADMIEADVRRTRDGRLVMLHDATVDRTTNGRGAVSDLMFEDVRRLDAGGWFSARFAGAQVPTLDEVFELAECAEIGLCLEAKGESAAERESLACAVACEIERRGRSGRDVLASFDHDALAAAAQEVPGLRLAPERLPERGESVGSVVVEQARALGAPIVQHHHADVTVETVVAVHAAALALWVWSPTSPADIERAVSLGVDGVMGDDVAAIVAAVRGDG
jgi:glycerophosphoryl diester phosphodiesterase